MYCIFLCTAEKAKHMETCLCKVVHLMLALVFPRHEHEFVLELP